MKLGFKTMWFPSCSTLLNLDIHALNFLSTSFQTFLKLHKRDSAAQQGKAFATKPDNLS